MSNIIFIAKKRKWFNQKLNKNISFILLKEKKDLKENSEFGPPASYSLFLLLWLKPNHWDPFLSLKIVLSELHSFEITFHRNVK